MDSTTQADGSTGKERVLVVEDDRVARQLAVEVLKLAGYATTEAASAEEALALVDGGAESFDLVMSDVRMGEMDGLQLLAELQTRHPDLPVVLVTAFGDVEGAMAATQAGAWDYLAKPFNLEEPRVTVRRALERRRLAQERKDGGKGEAVPSLPASGIVGKSAAMLNVYKMVARIARSSAPVLVLGESGTGKELVARAVHAHSARASGPFVAVSCAAMTETLLESELFGHERGAFTGAERARRGLFEQATGGTLFLDEIGEVPPKMQAQLLRVLQENEIRRVGGSENIKVDVRVVAATHRDLDEEVKQGRFREDLLFRLRVVSLRLPAMRERLEDVPPLVDYFVAQAARKENRPQPTIAPEAMEALRHYTWPGNVRELRNAVERAMAVASPDVVLASDLPGEITGRPATAAPARGAGGGGGDLVADRPTLAVLERRYVELILVETGGNKKRAAEILGIDRRTLYRTLDRDRPEEAEGPDAGEEKAPNGG
jgi:DNA-binding NtrC family response regulator